MHLSEMIKPISYVKSHAAKIVRDISNTSRSVIITQNGEAKAILMNLAEYEMMQDSLTMLKLAAIGTTEIREKRYKTANSAFKSVDSETGKLRKTIRK